MREPDCLCRIRTDKRWVVTVCLSVIAVIGVVVAGLATYVHYQTVASEGGYRSFCTLSDKVDCTAVVLTPQSRLLGIPISILGVFTYLIVFGLQIKGWRKGDVDFARSLALTTLIGFGCTAYSIYLGYIVIFIVQRHCLVCYSLYAVNVSFLFFGLLFALRWRVSISGMLLWEIRSILENRPVAIGTGLLILFCIAGGFVMRNVQRELMIQRNPLLLAIFDGSAKRVPMVLQNVPTWGPDEAPVSIIEFNDFQCPFCRQSVKTLAGVLREFPEQVRRQFVNLPLDKSCNPFVPDSLHQGSCVLAYAGRVAYSEGKFWEFHDRAFDHIGEWSDEAVISLLTELGVPPDEVEQRIVDPTVRATVGYETDFAHHLGIERTPSFIINGMYLEGNFDPWLWERIIRLEIERARTRGVPAQPEPIPARPLAPPILPSATGFL